MLIFSGFHRRNAAVSAGFVDESIRIFHRPRFPADNPIESVADAQIVRPAKRLLTGDQIPCPGATTIHAR